MFREARKVWTPSSGNRLFFLLFIIELGITKSFEPPCASRFSSKVQISIH